MRKHTVVAMSLGLLAGCSEPTAPANLARTVEPASALVLVGSVDSDLKDLPAVRVSRVSNHAGVAGQEVVFTLTGPDGSSSNVTVSTDGDGLAKLPSLRLQSVGRYFASAVTEGWGPIKFTILVPGSVVAIYDLKAIDGLTIPTSAFLVTEGHWVLYEGGFYNAFYNSPVQGFTVDEIGLGVYQQSASQIQFSPDFHLPGVSASIRYGGVGILRGNELTIHRGHVLDFPPELFVLR